MTNIGVTPPMLHLINESGTEVKTNSSSTPLPASSLGEGWVSEGELLVAGEAR